LRRQITPLRGVGHKAREVSGLAGRKLASLRERSGNCDQIFRGSGARAGASLPYPREFGSLPLGGDDAA